ncbi:MAG: endonuclease [Flavobacterium sp.]|nr:MAG: endonuclease [Flavobacterium sp.]
MPEGPSIVILREEASRFEGCTIIVAGGNTTVDVSRIIGGQPAFKSWGKHFLICFDDFTVRIHLLMFGSYRINEQKDAPARFFLKFDNGEINFYTCSVKIFEDNVNNLYDWSADVMNPGWNPRKAKAKLKEMPDTLICDALLEQDIFSGVGNIIKNEVLYRVKIHPESKTGNIPDRKLRELIAESRIYSFEFLEWKKKFELKKHWLAHTKKTCIRCNLPLVKKHTGVKKRRSFFCENCQKLY